MVGQLGSASSSYGVSLLLPAYAVVFLSKAAFKPGYINVPGVITSVALIILGTRGLELIGSPTWCEYMFQGVALMFSMADRMLFSHDASAVSTLWDTVDEKTLRFVRESVIPDGWLFIQKHAFPRLLEMGAEEQTLRRILFENPRLFFETA